MTPPRAPEPVARTEAPRADSVAPASAPSPAVAPRLPSAAGASPASGVGTDVTRGSADGSGDASTAAAPSGGGGAGTDGGRGGGTGVTSRVAAAAPGTGSGTGAGIGTDYAAYLGRLRQRIQESLRYPAMARRRGVTGTVQLEIAIAADGAIAAVSVIASSSHDILDRAAVEAARSLARAPFPADVRPRALTVRLPVVFELQ
jgi:protein TonB